MGCLFFGDEHTLSEKRPGSSFKLSMTQNLHTCFFSAGKQIIAGQTPEPERGWQQIQRFFSAHWANVGADAETFSRQSDVKARRHPVHVLNEQRRPLRELHSLAVSSSVAAPSPQQIRTTQGLRKEFYVHEPTP